MPGGTTSRKDADGKRLRREKIVIWNWNRGKGKRHTLVGLLELRLEGEVLHHVGGFLGLGYSGLCRKVDQCYAMI